MDQALTASDITALACNSPSYRDVLFSQNQGSCDIGGVAVTSEDIAHLTTKAYLKRRQEFPYICGQRPATEHRRQRQFKAAVDGDVKRELGIGFLGAILGILGGPLGLVLAVCEVIFSILLENELNGRISGAVMDAAAMTM